MTSFWWWLLVSVAIGIVIMTVLAIMRARSGPRNIAGTTNTRDEWIKSARGWMVLLIQQRDKQLRKSRRGPFISSAIRLVGVATSLPLPTGDSGRGTTIDYVGISAITAVFQDSLDRVDELTDKEVVALALGIEKTVRERY